MVRLNDRGGGQLTADQCERGCFVSLEAVGPIARCFSSPRIPIGPDGLLPHMPFNTRIGMTSSYPVAR